MSDLPIEVDVAAIGTGQATPSLAAALGARGRSVAVFESGLVGGSCVNVGCTPTKTLRKSARVAHLARRASEFGVMVGEVRVDFAAAMARVQQVVSASRNGLESWLTSAPGVTLVRAHARFAGRAGERFLIEADGQRFAASTVYVNTGTRPALPPVPGLAESAPLTSDTLLALGEAPAHLVIVGGSYIGLEFAQIFRRLGSDVTVLETSDRIASREDPDISARLTALLEGEGVRIVTGARMTAVERTPAGSVTVTLAGADAPVSGSHLLVATGRLPNTENLGLETVGIATDAQDYIEVDAFLQTNVPGCWALGDVNRRGAFTHTSYQDHEIVLANLSGTHRSAAGRITTYAMYTDPPLGRIGLSEREARTAMATGRRFLVGTQEMANVSRAKEEGETTGVIRVLVDADTRRFAGITMLGIHADEIVQLIAAMMAADAPYEALRDFLPVHPTVTEFFPTILKKLVPLA